MERDRVYEMILLADAGELDNADRAELDAALAADPELADYARDLGRLRDLTVSSAPEGPSEAVLQRISEAAQPRRVIAFPVPAMQWAAAAAAVVLIVAGAGFLVLGPPEAEMVAPSGALAQAERAESMTAIISIVSDEEDTDAVIDGSGEEHLKALAAQLLRFQGLDPEPFDGGDDEEADAFFDLS